MVTGRLGYRLLHSYIACLFQAFSFVSSWIFITCCLLFGVLLRHVEVRILLLHGCLATVLPARFSVDNVTLWLPNPFSDVVGARFNPHSLLFNLKYLLRSLDTSYTLISTVLTQSKLSHESQKDCRTP